MGRSLRAIEPLAAPLGAMLVGMGAAWAAVTGAGALRVAAWALIATGLVLFALLGVARIKRSRIGATEEKQAAELMNDGQQLIREVVGTEEAFNSWARRFFAFMGQSEAWVGRISDPISRAILTSEDGLDENREVGGSFGPLHNYARLRIERRVANLRTVVARRGALS